MNRPELNPALRFSPSDIRTDLRMDRLVKFLTVWLVFGVTAVTLLLQVTGPPGVKCYATYCRPQNCSLYALHAAQVAEASCLSSSVQPPVSRPEGPLNQYLIPLAFFIQAVLCYMPHLLWEIFAAEKLKAALLGKRRSRHRSSKKVYLKKVEPRHLTDLKQTAHGKRPPTPELKFKVKERSTITRYYRIREVVTMLLLIFFLLYYCLCPVHRLENIYDSFECIVSDVAVTCSLGSGQTLRMAWITNITILITGTLVLLYHVITTFLWHDGKVGLENGGKSSKHHRETAYAEQQLSQAWDSCGTELNGSASDTKLLAMFSESNPGLFMGYGNVKLAKSTV
ncbi:pannexin-3-like [Branchiostoma lanceolatum]|uniref:pannexin-3-like n=1 Tax=Branchiostoma lanceolatum TaxID=7740 RepID=UPI0034564BE8